MKFLTKLAFLSLLFLRNTCAISLSERLENNSKAIADGRCHLIAGRDFNVSKPLSGGPGGGPVSCGTFDCSG